MTTTIKIPEMSIEEIIKYSQTIKPIIRKDNKRFFLCNLSENDLTVNSYTLLNNNDKIGETADILKMHVIDDVIMYNKSENNSTFSPTVAEIIKQIPKEFLNNVESFEIIHCLDELKDDYNVALVRLYGKRS